MKKDRNAMQKMGITNLLKSGQDFVGRHLGRVDTANEGTPILQPAAETGQGPFKTVNEKDLEPDDIVIAVMGPTGSGKSTFICSASGCDTSGIGHTLKSFTDQVSAVKFRDQASRQSVVLVDTPGFDDTFKSDLDILNMISDWLDSMYNNKKLAGILYFHRITDNRMAGTPLKNLRVFRKLCGKDALDNVYLTTTMWDEVDPNVGEKRLDQLRMEYWKTMIDQGAQIARCRSDDDSAKRLVRQIIHHTKFKRNGVAQERMPTLQPPAEANHLHPLEVERQPKIDKGPVQTVPAPEVVEITLSMRDLEADDIIVAVMGPTNSGKSTFIRCASGREDHGVRHALKPFTSEVVVVRFWDQESGRFIVLVDIPGFDDAVKSGLDILKSISDWLGSSYRKSKLSGIVYLHPITDNQVAGASLQNFRDFQKLCGKDVLEKVYLTTTEWDQVDPRTGETRFRELETEYWKRMIDQGAHIARCRSDDDSAKRLIRQIVYHEKSQRNDVAQEGILTPQPPAEASHLHSLNAEQQPRIDKGSRTVPAPEVVETTLNIKDLEADDIVVAVMGPTGSGKSTFVRCASGRENRGVGYALKAFTSQVTAIRFWDQEYGRFVVLVDTPGFDDTSRSDLDILNLISDWLASSYGKHKLLSGILYLHRITDNRMAGTPLKNVRVFRGLCGRDAPEKVYLTTTMWDEVDEDIGEKRLDQLKTEYWKMMIDQGAKVARCRNDDGSPKKLIRDILFEEATSKPILLQDELVELKKELKDTAAGQQLYSQLEMLVEKQMELLRRIDKERKAASDPDILRELQTEYNELRAQIDDKLRQMQKLRLPRLKLLFTRRRD